MTNSSQPHLPESIEARLIDPGLTVPSAIVAAMMSEGYAAVAQVAGGATWEGEELVIDPGLKAHAERMALIWKRASENLQGVSMVRRQYPQSRADPRKGIPCGSRTARPFH
jgi:hypothetical protein